MVPGKEYTVFLTGSADPAHYINYVLSWNNPDLSVIFGATVIDSGDTVSQYNEYYSLVMVYNGAGATDITFTLEDPYVPEGSEGGSTGGGEGTTVLSVGSNSVYVTVNNYFCEGTTVSFTAETAGTYLISPADGEMNADITISDEFSSESLTMPYTFTLEAGETIEFTVFTSAYMTLTEDYIDLVITKK